MELGMVHVVRMLMIALVTAMITLFVVDFQSVLDGFTALIDGVSIVLEPIKGVGK